MILKSLFYLFSSDCWRGVLLL